MGIDLLVVTYCFYLAISIALTVWVARTLFRNGRVFLVDVFHGDDAMADSVNRLLVVGFYLGRCALCRRAQAWLESQPKFVPLEYVAAGSQEARRRFPSLDHDNRNRFRIGQAEAWKTL